MSISVTKERSNPSTAASATQTSGVSNLHDFQKYGPMPIYPKSVSLEYFNVFVRLRRVSPHSYSEFEI
jgi:hypothetical protein